jgi:hypothetical protein
MAVLACDLERGLVGFQARVAEEGVGQARELGQPGAELLLQRHAVVVGAVDELGDLVLQRRHQLGMGVAQRVDGDAAQAIEVLLAVGVPHPAALAMRHRDGQAAVGVHQGRRERGIHRWQAPHKKRWPGMSVHDMGRPIGGF